MYGFQTIDPSTGVEHAPAVGVSEGFVMRYMREALDDDPLHAYASKTGRAIYHLAVMDEHEWEETDVYRAAYSVHRMRHVVEAPILGVDGESIGGVHFASPEQNADFGSLDVELTEVIGRALGVAIANTRIRDSRERERDQAWVALELSGAAVAITSPGTIEPRLNDAAKRMLLGIVDAEQALLRLLALPVDNRGFSRRVEVQLSNGDTGILSAHSTTVGDDGGLATVLELRSNSAGLCSAPLGALTRREAEVAVLVSQGLADREIAAALNLSHHTVSQYVKRIYRKLDVDSRVSLTRLLLGAPVRPRRD